jgi:hypothetical protein
MMDEIGEMRGSRARTQVSEDTDTHCGPVLRFDVTCVSDITDRAYERSGSMERSSGKVHFRKGTLTLRRPISGSASIVPKCPCCNTTLLLEIWSRRLLWAERLPWIGFLVAGLPTLYIAVMNETSTVNELLGLMGLLAIGSSVRLILIRFGLRSDGVGVAIDDHLGSSLSWDERNILEGKATHLLLLK